MSEELHVELARRLRDAHRRVASLDGTDDAAIRSATEKVATSSQKLGSAMYAAAQASGEADSGATSSGSGGAGGGAGSSADADDVVDAEIVDDERPSDGENR